MPDRPKVGPDRSAREEVDADRDQAVLNRVLEEGAGAEAPQPGVTGALVGRLEAQGGRVVVVGGDQAGTINMGPVSVYASTSIDPRERRDRKRMLHRVRRTWIDGFMEDSLHGVALQTLGLQERPDAVPERWGMVVQELNQVGQMLNPNTSIVGVFDDLDSELLILGEPGSGKTTVLLELTRALLDRAEHDEALPLPIVFPLAPWAVKRLPLADWLVDELNQRYDVPRQIGAAWVSNDRLLPMLDGLDEVSPDHRAACVEAINAYRASRARTLPGVVVTSRVADYERLSQQLQLRGAVVLQPLRAQQIDAYLASAGDQLAGVRLALQADPVLQELATSPLLLSIMAVAYQGAPTEALPTSGTVEQRRSRLFATYVQQMLVRRAVAGPYSQAQTRRWLGWLARALTQQAQTILYLERLQPDWLPSQALKRRYTMLDRLGWGLALGLIVGLLAGLAGESSFGVVVGLAAATITALFGGTADTQTFLSSSPPSAGFQPAQRFWSGTRIVQLAGRILHVRTIRNAALGWLAVGSVVGLFTGLVFGLEGGLEIGLTGGLLNALLVGSDGGLAGALAGRPSAGPRQIRPVETIRWSLSRAGSYAGIGLVAGLVFGVVFALIGEVRDGPPFSLGADLIVGLVFALLFGIAFGLIGGFAGREVEARVRPNQGIRRSARTALLLGGLVGMVFGAMFELVNEPALAYGPEVGLVVGLAYGGFACLSHVALRVVLWRCGALPLDTVRFLDYATERVFLRRVGGGYIFVHRLLQEYFAGDSAVATRS